MSDYYGRGSAYAHGCRCNECREAARNRMRRRREERLAQRVLVAGRLIAPVAVESHGKASTYRNWGCRCLQCTRAHSAACAESIRRRAGEAS